MDLETSEWIDALLAARHDMIEECDFGGMVFLGLWWNAMCNPQMEEKEHQEAN